MLIKVIPPVDSAGNKRLKKEIPEIIDVPDTGSIIFIEGVEATVKSNWNGVVVMMPADSFAKLQKSDGWVLSPT